MKTKPSLRRTVWLAAVALAGMVAGLAVYSAHAAATVGSIGPNFTIKNHKTGQPLILYNYQGSIVLLDFWAYWCGPCQSAAADMEPNIVQFYRNNGGNANGIPVTVISISIDASNPTAVNDFISTYGLELVADDTANAYGAYGNGYIPYMVVLNGTTNATNAKTWEVRYSTAGYSRTAIKAAIDAIQTTPPVCTVSVPADGSEVLAGRVTLTANVTTNGKIIKKVEFYHGAALLGSVTTPPYSLNWISAPLGQRTVTAKAYFGTSSSVTSAPVSFTVVNPPPIQLSLGMQGQNMVLTWSGAPGPFQIQTATKLNDPDWQDLGLQTDQTSKVVTPGPNPGFYRVVRP